MSVLGILKMSGELPLNELNLRSPGTAADLQQELQALKAQGLVAFEGELPEAAELPLDKKRVRLTFKGLRQSLS